MLIEHGFAEGSKTVAPDLHAFSEENLIQVQFQFGSLTAH
jgi:hypothetical protein